MAVVDGVAIVGIIMVLVMGLGHEAAVQRGEVVLLFVQNLCVRE